MKKPLILWSLSLLAISVSATAARLGGDGGRLKYCTVTPLTAIVVKSPELMDYTYQCGGSYDVGQGLTAEKTCADFKLQNKGMDCQVSHIPNAQGSKYCIVRIDYTRNPTMAEQSANLCGAVAVCMGQAVAKDDRAGIAWANQTATELGCQ